MNPETEKKHNLVDWVVGFSALTTLLCLQINFLYKATIIGSVVLIFGYLLYQSVLSVYYKEQKGITINRLKRVLLCVGSIVLIATIIIWLPTTAFWQSLVSATPADGGYKPYNNAYGWFNNVFLALTQGGIVLFALWRFQSIEGARQTQTQETLLREISEKERLLQQEIANNVANLQREIAESQLAVQRSLESDRVKREQSQILAEFYREFSRLCLEHKLTKSRQNTEVRRSANNLVRTTLFRLESSNREDIIIYLYEGRFIVGEKPIVSLKGVSLQSIDLSFDRYSILFVEINLQGSDLRDSKFVGSHLRKAILDDANLIGADFLHAEIDLSTFRGSKLREDQILGKVSSSKNAIFPWS